MKLLRPLLAFLLKPMVLTVAGVVILELVVFFGGRALRPLLKLDDLSLLLIDLTLLLLFGLVVLWRRLRAQQNARTIELRLRAQAEAQVASTRPDRQAEIRELERKFDESLESLKSSRLGKSALYALPWHVIIGPPGSGKTKMLQESGLSFRTMDATGRGIRGMGGTRNCDWWFADEGILLDTAGRYTTEEEDHEEWLAFLAMIAKARKHKPINGVLVAISIADLVTATEDEVIQHAKRIRARIDELAQQLQLVFPIYLVFTKCDLLGGFVETFGSMTREQRNQVWGHTFTAPGKEGASLVARFETAFDALYVRACAYRLSQLGADRPPVKQGQIYSFPLQFSLAKERLSEFVRLVVQPSPYQEGIELRGFYFTSGTQEGEPLDRVLAAIGGAFGVEDLPAQAREQQEVKSYFIHDLFMKVVFPDQHLARSSARVQKRRELMRKASVVAYAAATLLLAFALFRSYSSNAALITQSRQALADAGFLREPSAAAPADLEARLDRLRLDYDAVHDAYWSLSPDHYFLGQSANLMKPVRATYLAALDRYYLVPLEEALEKRLRQTLKSNELFSGTEDKSARDKRLRSFENQVLVYERLGGKGGTSIEMLGLNIKAEGLWPKPAGLSEQASAAHLATFLERVATTGSDWTLPIDEQLHAEAKRTLNQADKVGASIDSFLAKTPDTPSLRPDQLIERFNTYYAEGPRAAGPAEDEAAERERTRRLFEELRQRAEEELRNYEIAKLEDLGKAREALVHETGAQSNYRRLYQRALDTRAQLAGFKDKTATINATSASGIDKPLEALAKLVGGIDAYLARATKGDRVLPNGIARFGNRDTNLVAARVGELLAAFDGARREVATAVGVAIEADLQEATKVALLAGIHSLEDALRSEASREAAQFWNGTLRERLQPVAQRFPFADKTESVDRATFALLFKKDGEFDRALKPLEDLKQKLGLDWEIDFHADRLAVANIQRVLFAADAVEPQLAFKLSFLPQAQVRITELQLSAEERPSTQMHPGELADKVWHWNGSSTALVRIETQGGKSLEIAPTPADSWSLFRLIGMSKALSAEPAKLTCTWVWDFKSGEGSPEHREAKIVFSELPEPDPLQPGFFRLKLPQQVFAGS